MMFNHVDYNNSVVRVASLVEQLESSVRRQALLLRRRRNRTTKSNQTYHVESSTDQINENQSKFEKLYPSPERKLISLCMNDLNQNYELRKRKGRDPICMDQGLVTNRRFPDARSGFEPL